MHSEIKSDKPGSCSKCGMDLVKETQVKDPGIPNEYSPLFIILSLIFVTSLVTSLQQSLTWQNLVYNFMIGFFLVFSGFKLIDLHGFAEGFRTYDLIAKRLPIYGYIYPFIELFFALSMIAHFQTQLVLILEILVMSLAGLGVAIKLAKKEKFQCVCLGTALKLPLTKVTLVENFGMAALALLMLIWA